MVSDRTFLSLWTGVLLFVTLPFWAPFALALAEERTPFDTTEWILDEGKSDVRLAMVGDLFDRHPLVGMSAEEAWSLLGPPEQSRTSGWTYPLGHRGGIDGFGALTLRLADDTVVDATVWFD